jgi:hypothetical protein
MPVILAFAGGKSWEQIDKAVIAGYDVMVRLARSGDAIIGRVGGRGEARCFRSPCEGEREEDRAIAGSSADEWMHGAR